MQQACSNNLFLALRLISFTLHAEIEQLLHSLFNSTVISNYNLSGTTTHPNCDSFLRRPKPRADCNQRFCNHTTRSISSNWFFRLLSQLSEINFVNKLLMFYVV